MPLTLLVPPILTEDAVRDRIHRDMKELQKDFMDLCVSTYRKMRETRFDVGRFKVSLHSCTTRVRDENRSFLHKLADDSNEDKTIDDVWKKLCNYWNFLNYTLLHNLVNRISNEELSKQMKKYVEKIKTFKRNTRVIDYLRYCPVIQERVDKADLRKTVEKHEIKWHTCSLQKFADLRRDLMFQLMMPAFMGLPTM